MKYKTFRAIVLTGVGLGVAAGLYMCSSSTPEPVAEPEQQRPVAAKAATRPKPAKKAKPKPGEGKEHALILDRLGKAADNPGESFNIGTQTPEISMRELADRVVAVGQDLLGYSGSVVQKTSDDPEYLTDNPNRRCPIITKAQTLLGYEPTVDIDDGLRRAMRWYVGQEAR